jgi:hypothetical protein
MYVKDDKAVNCSGYKNEEDIIIKKLLTVRNATCYIVVGKGG